MAEEILKDLAPASDGQYRLIPCECGGEARYRLIRRACGLLDWVVICPSAAGEHPGTKSSTMRKSVGTSAMGAVAMGNKSEYEILQALYRTHVRPLPHCPEWDHFGAFREWAEKTWSYGMMLRKIDPDGIWCPENAEFVDVEPLATAERMRMARQWDIARVRIARMLGVKLAQAKHPCENCGIRETCEKPCEARLDWWNVQMEKLRKELGV